MIRAAASTSARSPALTNAREMEVRQLTRVPEASRHLDKGEKLAAPVAIGTRGGRVLLLLGLSVWAITIIATIFIGDRIESLGGIVFLGGLAVGWLFLQAWLVSRNFAVALTDRRLLVFGCGGFVRRYILDVFIAAPRPNVSADFKSRFGWGVLRLEFALLTGGSPVRLTLWAVGEEMHIARLIHRSLGRSDGPQQPPGAVHVVERPANGDQLCGYDPQ